MDSKHHIRTLKLSRVSLLALGFYFLLSLTSCSGEYKGLPRAEMVAYQTEPTYGTLYNLALANARSLNDAVKADTLHPGLYAEYGITLALMGHDGTACRMLNAEVRAFPESRELILRVKRKLLPDMVDDTLCGERDTANLAQLASWAYDSLASLRPLPGIEAVIDSTDTVWLSQQTPVDSVVVPIRLTATQKRELLEQEQAAAERLRQARQDSIAAAKQAKLDARKQAQEQHKLEQKAKKQAQADAKKERDRRNKERQRQRDEEKKKKQQERKKK